MAIAKNEATAAKRRVPVEVFDANGDLAGGLTFAHASGEVFVTTDGGVTWVAAANDGVQTTGGPTPAQQTYYYEFSQAETNHDVSFIGVLFHKAGITRDTVQWAELDFSATSAVAMLVADIQTDVDELQATLADVQTDIDEIQTSVAELLGLHRKNSLLDGGSGFPAVQYTANREFLAGRLRVFASKAARDAAVAGHADGADGETHRYSLTGTGTGTGLQATFAMDLEL